MKITEVNKLEGFLVEMYNKNKRTNLNEVDETIKLFIDEFKNYIKTYDEIFLTDHANIVQKIYFDKHNIVDFNMIGIEEKIYIPRQTLYRYRKNYAKLIVIIMRKFGFQSM